MKKIALILTFILLANSSFCQNDNSMEKTIYQFKVKDIEGNTGIFSSTF